MLHGIQWFGSTKGLGEGGGDDTRVVVTIGVVGGTLPGTRTFGRCEGNLAWDKGWPGCYMDTTIDLEVKEVGALKYMVFIPKGATYTYIGMTPCGWLLS